MQLKNANILLTGGKGGLGSALVDKLRVRGAKVLTAGLDSGESIHIDFSDPKSVGKSLISVPYLEPFLSRISAFIAQRKRE